MKTTIIHHSADYDGIFCREIACKFLPDAELIGWDFGDKPLVIPDEGQIYILDLPVDRVFGFEFKNPESLNSDIAVMLTNLTWIDHHKSAIESHPTDINGYRIDGVAACRLAWQWFKIQANYRTTEGHAKREEIGPALPSKEDFVDRRVSEPLAVRLAGEYDIWDKRDPDAELFQHGLRAQELTPAIWTDLLSLTPYRASLVDELLVRGQCLQYAKAKENSDIITHYGFTLAFEGLTFLACNHARYNSFLFTAGLKPEHDACFGFKWNGRKWEVSLYHAPGKEHHDLSQIAVKHGGGGHRGACGFTTDTLPFL